MQGYPHRVERVCAGHDHRRDFDDSHHRCVVCPGLFQITRSYGSITGWKRVARGELANFGTTGFVGAAELSVEEPPFPNACNSNGCGIVRPDRTAISAIFNGGATLWAANGWAGHGRSDRCGNSRAKQHRWADASSCRSSFGRRVS